MKKKKQPKNKRKILILLTLSVLGLIGIIFGVSLAFFSYIKEGITVNTINSGAVVFQYDEISGKGRGINIVDALPTDSNEMEKTNNNYFEFRIKSHTTILEVPYTVAVRLSEDTNMDNSIVRIYLTEVEGSIEKEILYTTLNELENKVFVRDYPQKVLYRDTVPVDGNDYEKVFRLRMWIDEDVDYSTGELNDKKLSLTVNVYTNDGSTIERENVTTKEDTGIKMISANNMYEAEKVSDPEPEQEMIEKNVNYDLTVPYEVNTINFDIITRNMKADVEVEELGTSLSYNDKGTVKRMNNSNTYNLAVRDNYFKVKVTSADKSERTNYLLRVDREYDKDNSLTYLAVDGYSFTEEFDKDTLIYNTVGLETDKITILGNKSSEVASIEGLGEKSLSWGENRFNVVVTPQDPNTSSKTYTIIVNRVRPTSPTLEATTNEWTATNPVVSVLAQGSAIGGIDHYEVYKADTINLPTDETEATSITDDTYTVDTNGIYRIYYRTVSGNGYKSLWSSPQVVKVDKSAPTNLAITASDSKTSNTWHTADYTLTMSAQQNGGSNITYYHGSDLANATVGTSRKIDSNTAGSTYYMKACNEAGVCSDAVSYIAKLDKTTPSAPTITGGAGTNKWNTANFTISVPTQSNVSGNTYYIDTSSTNPATSRRTLDITSETNGTTYYAKVCSGAGLCSTVSSGFIALLDKTNPGCTFSGENDKWTASNKTITATCTDNGSKCTSGTASKTWTYNSGTTSTVNLSYTITDNAGNSTTCSKNGVKVYVDKQGPTTPTGGAIGAVSGSSTTGSIKTAASGSTDSGVGGITYKYMVTNSSTAPANTNTGFTTSKNFTRSCGKSYYAYAIAEDSLGNRSAVKSLGSTSDGANSYNGWTACTKSCGTGTQTRTNNCALVTTGLSQNCNTQTCCSKTTYKDTNGKWGGCSKSCGTGSQSYTVTRTYYSAYDGSYCSATNNLVTSTQNCNTNACVAEAGNVGYTSLQGAINSSSASSAKLLQNTSEMITIPTNSSVSINLNGKTLNPSATGNTITVKDGSSLTISGGTVNGNQRAIIVLGNGYLSITGGSYNASDWDAVVFQGSSSGNLSGGTINGKGYGVYMESSGTVTINGATVIGQKYDGIYVKSGTANLATGTLKGHNWAAYGAGGLIRYKNSAPFIGLQCDATTNNGWDNWGHYCLWAPNYQNY